MSTNRLHFYKSVKVCGYSEGFSQGTIVGHRGLLVFYFSLKVSKTQISNVGSYLIHIWASNRIIIIVCHFFFFWCDCL